MNKTLWFILILSLAMGILAIYASTNPDGLEKVATDLKFSHYEKNSHDPPVPFKDYEVNFIKDKKLSRIAASIFGIISVYLFTVFILKIFNSIKQKHETFFLG